jgi:hypothetical protein
MFLLNSLSPSIETVIINERATMDFMTSPKPISPSPNAESKSEREKQAGIVPSQGISVQGDSQNVVHRPPAIRHVYDVPHFLGRNVKNLITHT